MNRLWAPWRIKYIKSAAIKGKGKKQAKCIFCANKSHTREENYVIFTSPRSTARLNIFPYNNGHLLISPRRHIKEFSQLSQAEIIDIFKTLNRAKNLLDKVLKPDGYNIGINISRSAGAGITGHLHLHIVPRWAGDTNFMPALFNTKIISQSLAELYKQLKNADSKTD